MRKKDVIDYIDQIKDEIQDVSFKIWSKPEIAGEEKYASWLYRKILGENGFEIKEIEDMEYAFFAEYGSGSPVIAVLGEYDALPGLSQAVDTRFNPVEPNGPGHACGHNLLGAAALGAVLAIKKYLESNNLSGTIRFYGCPEEETLSGKVKMIKKGAFAGCDLALSWHPMNVNAALEQAFLAMNSIKFRFHGISAHAAQSPEAGRSALDAVELMNVGANYLREHINEKARLHYTITNAGGAPNIVPKEAESWYFVRAPLRKDVEEITERLIKVAMGAAMMTETAMEYEVISGCYEILPNKVLFDLTYDNMMEIEPPSYTVQEIDFARSLQKTLDPHVVEAEIKKFMSEDNRDDTCLHRGVLEKEKTHYVKLVGSSDIGDVSWIMPMNFFLTACCPLGVALHSWQATASAGSSIGMKGMLYAAKVLAGIMYDLLNNPDIVSAAKLEFAQRTENRKYINPLKC